MNVSPVADDDYHIVASTLNTFQTLLIASGSPLRTQATVTRGKASPSQMFEPAMTDAHERRRAALKEDDVAARMPRAGDDRLDASRISDRRESAARPPQGLRGGDRNVSGEASAARPGWESATGGRETPPADASVEPYVALESSHGDAGEQLDAAARMAPGRQPLSSGLTDGIDSVAPGYGVARGAEPLGAVANPAPVQAGAQHAGSVAQQIGESLTVSRVGEVETARAPGPTSAAENPGAQVSRHGHAEKASPQRTGSSEPAPHSKGEADVTRTSRFDQLVRSIRLRASGGQSSAQLRLEPPELGRIHVDVRMHNAQLRVRVRTETAKARELLSGRAAELRAALANHGIHIERFDIAADFPVNVPAGSTWEEASRSRDSSRRDRRHGDRATSTSVVSSDEASEGNDDGASAAGTARRARLDIRI
ncbi:MAG: flagellar hook-length control protein FliK [Phycisphaerae bacterium]